VVTNGLPVYFDEATARDLLDAFRQLERRLIGGSRQLSPGARLLRAVAERSLAILSDACVASPPDPVNDRLMKLLTIPDVGAVLQQSVPKVRRLIDSGELKAVKTGRNVRVRPEDLDAYIAALPSAREPAA